jgi:hypothetical protein
MGPGRLPALAAQAVATARLGRNVSYFCRLSRTGTTFFRWWKNDNQAANALKLGAASVRRPWGAKPSG